jgi:hypothetical protein
VFKTQAAAPTLGLWRVRDLGPRGHDVQSASVAPIVSASSVLAGPGGDQREMLALVAVLALSLAALSLAATPAPTLRRVAFLRVVADYRFEVGTAGFATAMGLALAYFLAGSA